jgi:hypothetical protein
VEHQLLVEGKAEFEIDSISDRDAEGNYHVSKAGNRMIKAVLHVRDANGDFADIWVNIVLQGLYKLRSLCEAVGMPEVYKQYKVYKDETKGQRALEELREKEGYCELFIKRDEQYGDRMDIRKFLPKSITLNGPSTVKKHDSNDDSADNIPF